MIDQIKVGSFLRLLRKEKGKTQEELAEMLGVSSRSVSRWENGNTMPDLVLLVELADYYDVDIREIIDGERKCGKVQSEQKETLLKVADYAEREKKKAVNRKKTVILVCCGVIAALGLALGAVLCLLGSIADDVSLLYEAEFTGEGFIYGVNKTAKTCFAGQYECTEYTPNCEITIPDEFDGKPITKIGGYHGRGVPTPFFISVDDVFMNAPAGTRFSYIFNGDLKSYQFDVSFNEEDVVFVLNIGKNVKTVEYVEMGKKYPHVNEDGSVTFYHPVVYINCSEENKNFYSENGKLYNRKTDELITEFDYAD